MNIAFLVFLNIIFLVIAIFFSIIPFLTRKTESFGVTIPEEVYNEQEVVSIRKSYRNSVVVFGIVFLTLLNVLFFILPSVVFQLYYFLIYIFELTTFFVFYIRGHYRMKRLKENKKWSEGKKEFVVASLKSTGNQFSPLWIIYYLIIMLITLWIGIVFYDRIPEKVVIHWDAKFNPNKWVSKTYFLILFPVIMQLFLSVIFFISYYVIIRAREQIDPAKPEESFERVRIFKKIWANFIVFAGFLMLSIFLFMQISFIVNFSPQFIMVVIFGLTGVIVLASLVISIFVGQGGSRLKLSKEKEDKNIIVRDDDKYWKLGVFYFNPDDPAVFVEKRFGIGWTFNWARPLSWILLLGLFLLMGVILLISIAGLK